MEDSTIPLLTPIHDLRAYGLAIVVVYGLSSVSLASHIRFRWRIFVDSQMSYWMVRSAIMAFAIFGGIYLFGAISLFGNPRAIWIVLAPIGLGLGWVAAEVDRAIIRHCLRSSFGGTAKWVSSGATCLLVRRKQNRYEDSTHVTRNAPDGLDEFGLVPMVTTAVLEELVYRGVLVRACFESPSSALLVISLTATVFAFSLTHINFGWPQVFAKVPLSALALAATLSSGTVLPAVFAHVVFNGTIWKKRKAEGFHGQ